MLIVYKNPQESKDKTTQLALKLIQERDHQFVSGTYENRQSIWIVCCPEHNIKYKTTFYNYNRSHHGTPCCANQVVSEKFKNRSFSEETLKKMALSAQARGYRGGMDRRWRENAAYRNWKKGVVSNFNGQCAISKQSKSANGLPLVGHHLISAHTCYQLVLEPLNGILIAAEFHTDFHLLRSRFSYKKNTVEQFQDYLNQLIEEKKGLSTPISNQGGSEDPQGSETRVYDLEQVMELQERLGVVSKILTQKINEAETLDKVVPFEESAGFE